MSGGLTGRPSVVDSDPHPVFTTYSAGNFAEVAPNRISPMSWSLVGLPVERGMRQLVGRVWPGARWATGSHFVFVGYFGCRPYHNLSAFCQLAYGIPGLDPALVARSYFEDAPVPAPPGGRAYRGGAASTLPRLVREMLRTRRQVGMLAEEVAELESATNGLAAGYGTGLSMGAGLGGPGGSAGLGVAAGADARLDRGSDAGLDAGFGAGSGAGFGERPGVDALALGRLVPGATRLLDRVWAAHYASTMTLLPLLAVQDGVARRFVPYWRELEPLVNRPDALVWQRLGDLGEVAPEATEFLYRQFYEVADDLEPWDRYAGTGGPPATGGPADELLPEDPWALVPLSRQLQLPRLSGAVRIAMEQREHTKSLAMRAMHCMRPIVRGVAGLRGLADGDWPYLSVSELLDESLGRGELRDRARHRRDECAAAVQRPMPDLFDTAPDAAPATDNPRAAYGAGRGVGVGVCPGQVSGVVVVPGPDGRYRPEPPAAGAAGGRRVLVCERADVHIQTVLPHIDALVTARGSALSHVAILLREHGLPSVVGHPLASQLRAGQEIYVDGTTGEVKVLA